MKFPRTTLKSGHPCFDPLDSWDTMKVYNLQFSLFINGLLYIRFEKMAQQQ
uniref:Uncharacterized protein n=1 Tax=Heterorhabditis bacteriophora TaxID=37862 RepID=A0A1I7WTL5_HETBA